MSMKDFSITVDRNSEPWVRKAELWATLGRYPVARGDGVFVATVDLPPGTDEATIEWTAPVRGTWGFYVVPLYTDSLLPGPGKILVPEAAPNFPDPVALWNMNDSSGFPTDSIGSANMASAGASTFTPGVSGIVGNCYECSDMQASIPGITMSGSDWTISKWFKYDGVSTFPYFLLAGSTSPFSTTNGIGLDYSGSGEIEGRLDDTTYVEWLTPVPELNDGSWHLYVLARDADTMRIWIDSVEVSVTSSDLTNFLLDFTSTWYCRMTAGFHDQMALWDTVLTQDNIEYLYNGGAGRAI